MNINTHSHRFGSLVLASLLLAFAGCGGGGGGGSSDTPVSEPPAQSLADMQGFWSGPMSGATLQTATSTQGVVLADGTAWFLLIPASGASTGMVKASLTVSGTGYAGTGKVYDFASLTATPVAMTGTAVAASSQTLALTPSGASGATTTSLTYSNAYATPAVLADVGGNWQVSASAGALHINWVIQADGTLAGASTTGCTWTGAFRTRSGGKAVLDFAASETCESLTATYSGIAVLNSTKSGATLFITTEADAQGFALGMTKQTDAAIGSQLTGDQH
ncbi:MAG: hypothetical protein ABI671_00200 [Burkholderiales bacterium]